VLIGGGVVFFLILVAIILIVRRDTSDPSDSASGKNRDIFAQYKAQEAEKPKDPEIQLKWGHALALRASESKIPFRRAQLYKEAAERFRRATELAPSLAVAWKTLGQTLYLLLRLESCEDRAVLANANAAYESAIRLSPANASFWQHWGEDLYMAAAYCKDDEKREELVSMAKARYARAVALNPDLLEAWRSWGGSLAALDEVQAAAEEARQRLEDRPAGLEQTEGDILLTPGARAMLGQSGGAMPWELEAGMEDAEKFFSETPAPVQRPASAGAETEAESRPEKITVK
jgi:tetratricopeptide (TPR) repeat protein